MARRLFVVEDATHITPREREMVLLMAEDLDQRGIAKRLFISHNTVRSTLGRVHKRWGVSTGAGLLAHALRHGLVSLGETVDATVLERARAEVYQEVLDWVVANCDETNRVPAIALLRFVAPESLRAKVG